MADQPERREVRVSDAMLRQAAELFGQERSPSGRPSYADFEDLLLPTLLEAIAVLWKNGQPVPGYDEVRELVTEPHLAFGPARVTAMLDGDLVVIVGFEPDGDFWSQQ